MNNTVCVDIETPGVKFVPPLHEQRRSWALEIVRRERVTTILDVGCGEGVLLQHLTHAPPWRAHTSETPAPRVFERPDFIHARELHGLDILQDDLVYAAEITAPAKHAAYGWTRFSQLDVSIWEGGLQIPNPAFKGIECIIATEVIEHLTEDVVDAFSPSLLGNYAPRLLLLTTPCFDFNERFSAPGEEHWGFADPTGRTNRVFRHADHKFEWTVDECAKWCKETAELWGYDVVMAGVGRSTTKDQWGRGGDGDTLRASQTALFRRREGDDWATRRAERYAKWASQHTNTQPAHKKFASHCYEAHVGAQSTPEDITTAAKSTIQAIGSPEVNIFDIWREDAVSTICGGWLEVLLDALDKDDAFVLRKEGKNVDDWKIELPGVELQAKKPWESSSEHDGWGESSESADSSETYDDDDEAEYDDEEYDGDDWDETSDSGWAASDSEGVSKEREESDINTLKAWEDWRPAPGWIVDSSWD